MKSIRIKLFIGITLILSIFFSGVLIYGLNFKNYFQKEKFHEMDSVISSIEEHLPNASKEDLINLVDSLSTTYNVQIDIKDALTERAIYSTHKIGRNSNMNNAGMLKNRFEILKNWGVKNKISRELLRDKSTGIDFLTSSKAIKSTEYSVVVRTPISVMDDAVKKSVSFLMLIFLPITIIVLLAVVLFSKTFTKPIIEITKKTSKIKDLNFSDDLNVLRQDELGVLATSVNDLSHKIEFTLKELNEKNLALEEMIKREQLNHHLSKKFVSDISHELKSPISVISGYAQALEAGFMSSKEDSDYYISVINEESQRMSVIVNDLLDLYKLQSKTFALNLKEINLCNLVKSIIKKNQLIIENENINLITELEEVNVIGDKVRLEQAIQNYINNALSHIDDTKTLKISVTTDTTSAYISVYNSGKNISKEDIDTIWERFVRVDKVRNYKENRVGLGLSIVSEIVKLHNGTYGVYNKDNGVEFWIKLNLCL